MIRFLFKSCFILVLLFIALSFFVPAARQAPEEANAPQNTAGILAAASAFGAFIHYVDGFCARSPQSCETGKSLLGQMSEKASLGAGLAFQWLRGGLHAGAENTDKHLEEQNNTSIDAIISNAARETPAAGKPPKTEQKLRQKPAAQRKSAEKTAQKPKAKPDALKDKAR